MDRVKPECIKNPLNRADIEARVKLVKELPEKIAEPKKIVETLQELFRWETNGEVIYWGVRILEKLRKIPGALEIVGQKLDDCMGERYQKYAANDMIRIPAGKFLMGSPGSAKTKPEKPYEPELTGTLVITDYFIVKYHGYTFYSNDEDFIDIIPKNGAKLHIHSNFILIQVFDENYDALINKLKLQDKICFDIEYKYQYK